MLIERDMIQGSDEWFTARCGNLGASSLDKIVTSTGKKSTQRQKYLYQLAGEIMIGKKEESFKSAAMERGTELEPKARQLFQFETGLQVEEVGMCYPDELKQWHVSPDGLIIGQNKGLEIKCPLLPTHIEYLSKNKLPTKYKCQVQGSLLCTGYESWFFMSYYPDIKPLIIEVERDERFIAILTNAITLFCYDLNQLVEKLK